jgi:uncharacterized phage infection (PIP) family protein YhgE
MYKKSFISAVILFFIITVIFSGCKSQQPVVIDTGDIRQLRYELESLREEYNRLQSDYQQLANDSKFYADYYQHATETIAAGIRELNEIGTDSMAEIQKLRNYATIFRNIINNINTGEGQLQNGTGNREGQK